MSIQNIYVIIILVISMLLNIFIYLKLIKKDNSQISETSNIEAHMILIDRKLSEIKSDMQYLSDKVDNIQLVRPLEFDETTAYIKSGMTIPEMAKKMNKSIKEVELMLKMRGLV